MCEVIDSVGSWIGTNAIALAALAVAVATVNVTLRMGQQTLNRMKEQFDDERQERQDRATAEQRYEIFLKVDELMWHYQFKQLNEKMSEKVGTVPDFMPKPRSTHLEIIRLLNRPTGMSKDEITFILSNLKNLLLLSTDDALLAILRVHQELRMKLNPDVGKAFDELKKQEEDNNKSITPNLN